MAKWYKLYFSWPWKSFDVWKIFNCRLACMQYTLLKDPKFGCATKFPECHLLKMCTTMVSRTDLFWLIWKQKKTANNGTIVVLFPLLHYHNPLPLMPLGMRAHSVCNPFYSLLLIYVCNTMAARRTDLCWYIVELETVCKQWHNCCIVSSPVLS